ncbi:arrestin domain-containing protein 3-like [Brachyhypopomus gauderio]|uniref:arrestin domain-containing protein 3-like n=1 Tax=Brachyhypopomus gauderio TaxID=698409 RepID=UPI00404250D5
MPGTIKDLSLNYDPVKENNTFTCGDFINGRVILEVTKEVKIDSLYVKFKGDANVRWSERRNDQTHVYSSHERYFKLKQFFIQDPSKKGKIDPGAIIITGETYSNMVKPGSHVFPFSFQVPQGNMPASFKGHYGSVKYILEVTLDRSWKIDRTDTKEIIFVPGINSIGPNLMIPQSGATDKKMKLFTSGSASIRATMDKMGCMQGEIIKVSTDVDNSSSRDLKLKYSLEQKQTFCAQGRHKYCTNTIFKVVGDPVPSGSKQTVVTQLTIPPNLELTIMNCGIIKVEYILKVYLDVPYASDPEIQFPVVILPAGLFLPPLPSQQGFQAFGNPDTAGWSNVPPQPAFGPGPPGAAYGPAPGQYPNMHPSPVPPQPVNPEAPPPPYSCIYPNLNPPVPGYNPAPLAPTFSPPQYPIMGYPNPTLLNPAPSAPEFCPNPAPPAYGSSGGESGWPNSTNQTNQPEPYPTKTPEKHE